MAWVYILECADGSYYTGSTIDLERRLQEHHEGIGANFTRKNKPFRLVFAEECSSITDTFAREKQIQGWGRAKKQALIEGRLGDLPGLSLRPGDRPSRASGTVPSRASGVVPSSASGTVPSSASGTVL